MFLRDAELTGFGAIIRPTGTVSFFAEAHGHPRKVLGKWGDITADDARGEAGITLGSWGKGQTAPIEEQGTEAPTLEDVLDDYIDTRTLKPRTEEDYRMVLDTALNDWKKLPMTSITRAMVHQRHRELGRKSKSRANNAMRVLRALFNYAQEMYEDAQERPLVTGNPVLRLNKVDAWYHVPRRRTTIKGQLKDWYQAVEELESERGNRGGVASDYLRFLLFTGVRMREGLGLTFDAVDLDQRIFICEETKNWQEHALPMSEPVFEILDRRTAEIGPFVFPGQNGPLQDVRYWIAKVADDSGVSFTLNDLRRTFISVAESLDLSGYTLKRLLNHKMTEHDVTAGYIVTDVERLRAPMQRIGDEILRIVGAS